jgi:hypothetical protein
VPFGQSAAPAAAAAVVVVRRVVVVVAAGRAVVVVAGAAVVVVVGAAATSVEVVVVDEVVTESECTDVFVFGSQAASANKTATAAANLLSVTTPPVQMTCTKGEGTAWTGQVRTSRPGRSPVSRPSAIVSTPETNVAL